MLTVSSDQIFDKARIVNCALMAKIHTVEWTPAILAHPALQIGMSANWWVRGLESIYRFVRHSKRMSRDDAVETRFPMTLLGVY